VFSKVEFARHGPNTPASVEEFLERRQAARGRGYSIVDEEAEPGLYSLAVPVRDFKDDVVAALQIVGIKDRLAPRREQCATALMARGSWLESRLGYRG
jgi:DNA-binding IclR family transcriptional regulator